MEAMNSNRPTRIWPARPAGVPEHCSCACQPIIYYPATAGQYAAWVCAACGEPHAIHITDDDDDDADPGL